METQELTHWKKNFNYDYLGSYSLDQGKDMILTITKTGKELVKSAQHPKGEECFCAYFDEVDKPMILNATNCKTIESLYTAYVENWVGKKVQLYVANIRAFGSDTDALRIRDFVPQDKKPLVVDSAAWKNAVKKKIAINKVREHYLVDEKTEVEYLKAIG